MNRLAPNLSEQKIDYGKLAPLLHQGYATQGNARNRSPELGVQSRTAMPLSLLSHAVLITLLVLGVSWKNKTPETVQAELWDTPTASSPASAAQVEPAPELLKEPEPVATKPPEPAPPLKAVLPPAPPQPSAADIALEKAKLKEKEKEKAKEKEKIVAKAQEAEKNKRKVDAEKAAEKASDDKRQKELDRLKGLAGTAQTNNNPANKPAAGRVDAGFAGRVRSCIRGNMRFDQDAGSPNFLVQTTVSLLPSGAPASVNIRKASGNTTFDAAVERAIMRCDPFPKPDAGGYPSIIDINYSLRD